MAEEPATGPTVQRVDVPAQHTAVVRRQVPPGGVSDFVEEALGLVIERASANGWQIAGRPVARFQRRGSEVEAEVGYPVAQPVPRTGEVLPSRLPGGPVVTVLHVGAPERLEETYRAARDWMRLHQLELVDTPWECYLDGPGSARPRTAVYLPCARERIPQQRGPA